MPTGNIPADQILNLALASLVGAIQGYYPALLIWGANIVNGLFLLGAGYVCLMAFGKRDWGATIMTIGFGLLKIILAKALIMNLEFIGSIPFAIGNTIGQAVTGQSPNVLTPSGIYDLGLTIVNLLFHARLLGSWFNLVADGEFVLLIVLIDLTWFAVALIYLWIIFECQWTWVMGTITVCFAPFEYTWETFTNWLGQMLRCGIQLAAALVVLAVGITIAGNWGSWMAGEAFPAINSNQIANGAVELAEAILFFYAVWKWPAKAASFIQVTGMRGATASHEAEQMFGAITREATGGGTAGRIMRQI